MHCEMKENCTDITTPVTHQDTEHNLSCQYLMWSGSMDTLGRTGNQSLWQKSQQDKQNKAQVHSGCRAQADIWLK